MKAYRVFWLCFCGVLGAMGAVMAFTWSLTNLILLFVLRPSRAQSWPWSLWRTPTVPPGRRGIGDGSWPAAQPSPRVAQSPSSAWAPW